jgi:hypothetical protein
MSDTPERDPNPCEHLKALLVEHGEVALDRHPELAAHLAGCAACRRLLAAWDALPGLLDALPEHEPEPALVARVRAAVASAPARKPAATRGWLAPSLASAAILLAAVGISRELLLREVPRTPPPAVSPSINGEPLDGPQVATRGVTRSVAEPGVAGGRLNDELDRLGKLESDFEAPEEAGRDDAAPALESRRAADLRTAAPEARSEESALAEREGNEGAYRERAQRMAEQGRAGQEQAEPERAGQEFARQPLGQAAASKPEAKQDKESFDVAVAPPPAAPLSGAKDADFAAPVFDFPAFDFFGHYGRTDGLVFQPATGYWANTHVPGDPAMRLLSARLAQWDRAWLPPDAGLERDVRPIVQPFDAPADNALALSLMADAAGVAADGEPTRLRLQVGLQGIEHRRGQRPAMNVGVVVDLPPDAPDTARIAARALLDALLESRQAGDRFAVVLTAGTAGDVGLVIAANDFRFGTLQIAKERILGHAPAEPGPGVPVAVPDTHAALERAGALVKAGEEPGRPLGSSAVLLISAGALDDLERLTALTHAHARDGITTSVFPLGNGLAGEAAEQLVLAGLGSRRILAAPADARRLIEEELHASSRAVARAARLSIRLAPGVKLVDVIGSERLDEPRAQRVREIENALDQRLAADLGIQADRGRDEDGIQIVIPAIHAGDSAIVLLDLVTDRPGAIAEVTLRYKDLVFLRNGSLSATLELPRAEPAGVAGPSRGAAEPRRGAAEPRRGTAEIAVLKNLLARHFSAAVAEAADALGQGDAAHAGHILRAMHATLAKARADLLDWSQDPDLIRDEQVLERYIAALESPQAATDALFLADSLRLAAYAKTQGLPEEWK